MRIAVIAPGAMGAAVAWRLHQRGAEVAVTLAGRGGGSAARAAGLATLESEAALVRWAEAVLSILPPGEALGLAERLAPVLAERPGQVLYADCNAVSPPTVQAIAAAVPAARFVDVGIIGGPPKQDGPGPKLYASGPHAPALLGLCTHGIDLRVIEGGSGAASALKMSYAGITKGLTALGSAMALGAAQAGAAEALRAELADSQPALLAWLQRSVPDMFPKAYRWVAEMQEISAFLGDIPARDIHLGAASLFAALAEANANQTPDGPIARLTNFYRRA
ncbi:MAG: NAD(P)-dependent oxidoreductase [Rhodospirillales bacterium]|nr:NAD(P)-dependent oxidoreductase [Rhodospirillales bacterium]